jgi:hypothetical protein
MHVNADFVARFDAGEVEWDGDQLVVAQVKSTRERLVARLTEILPEQASEIVGMNA